MDKLHVEELESRQLLTSASIFPQPPPAQLFAVTTYAVVVSEHSVFVELDGRAASFGNGWANAGWIEIDFLQSMTHANFGGGGLERFGLRAPARQTSDAPGTGIPVDVELVRMNTDSTTPAPAVLVSASNPANRGAAQAAVLGTLLERPNLPLRPLPESSLSTRAVPVAVLGRSAVPSVAWAMRQEGDSGSSMPAQETGQRPIPSTVSPAVQTENSSALPFPQRSDILSVVSPFDLSAVELGMQQLLEQLKAFGPPFAGEGAGTSLWPWIVALAGTASAMEIARRELRRPLRLPAGEVTGLSGFPDNSLFGA